MIELFPHQIDVLNQTSNQNRVAYYLDMGLGKTFVGSEKMKQLGEKINLVICQKSKIDDWYEHFKTYYDMNPCDLTKVKASDLKHFIEVSYTIPVPSVYIINYDLAFRRPELKKLANFTLMLDESSMIQNETAKRSKFILNLNPKNVILLSGTPTSGKYENLWSQCSLLGWDISKDLYWKQYIDTEILDNEGYPIKVIKGYKNVERLKRKLRQHGAVFVKSEEVFDLPEQIDIITNVRTTKEYRKFRKDSIVSFEGELLHTSTVCGGEEEFHELIELVGDTTLTKMLYERQLCGQYNREKLEAFQDLLESTSDRLIVFYNFTDEMDLLADICDELDRPTSFINGAVRDLQSYELYDNSVTFIQYQAGAMGLNLQKANKIVYFTPPLSSELFEQSKKRIHRIGQKKSCFYYYMTCKNSIEEKIYETLAMRKDYTDALFKEQQ